MAEVAKVVVQEKVSLVSPERCVEYTYSSRKILTSSRRQELSPADVEKGPLLFFVLNVRGSSFISTVLDIRTVGKAALQFVLFICREVYPQFKLLIHTMYL
ncbi:hypothetical protein TNCV_1667351 [Trichonephila clavipes]|nr:hypothetical protein TNCV_1667351 [Trichonephila clavipes]